MRRTYEALTPFLGVAKGLLGMIAWSVFGGLLTAAGALLCVLAWRAVIG